MIYLLDTNVCINILNGKINTGNYDNIKLNDVGISSITAYELYYGAFKSRHIEKNLKRINDFLNHVANIPFDDKISSKAGEIRTFLEKQGTTIGPYDLLIGSTALVNNYILVTHNTKEFERIPELKLEDWEK